MSQLSSHIPLHGTNVWGHKQVFPGEVLAKYCTVCLKKNIPDIFSCNSRKHCRIFIMFGTHVTKKVSNQ